MLKRISIGLSGITALIVVFMSTAALAQPFSPPQGAPGKALGRRSGVERRDAIRIIKGTIERISDDFIVLDVDTVFIPREGAMKPAPETVKLAVADASHFVKAGEKRASLEDFSAGEPVVALTTYKVESGYTLRALLDPESALKARERMAQRFGIQRGGRSGMMRGGPRERGGMDPSMSPGRPGDMRGGLAGRGLPPLLVGTYLGPSDNGAAVRLKLTGMLVRQPRTMMRERKGEDRGLPRGGDRAVDRGKRYHEFPEPKEVTVQLTGRCRLFSGGEKATLRDFESGDEIVAIIRGRAGAGEEAFLMMMADHESAAKLMKLLVEHGRRVHQRGLGERPAKPGAF
ncbi:MAG: hypothetical protein B1H03_04465 [Planctomycetales bacterium 4484_113]|nr:MAG: hypothetical protein B1H03_04465 [Planctomycetales bacterium 4484_113]